MFKSKAFSVVLLLRCNYKTITVAVLLFKE